MHDDDDNNFFEKPDPTTILGLKLFGYGAAVAILAAFAVGYFYL
ncbi:MAG: hypothetical protein AAFO61_04680 [Pseudomonadota bacterium]